jgi:hypothetical protein
MSWVVKCLTLAAISIAAIIYFRGLGHVFSIVLTVFAFRWLPGRFAAGRKLAIVLLHLSWIVPLTVYFILRNLDPSTREGVANWLMSRALVSSSLDAIVFQYANAITDDNGYTIAARLPQYRIVYYAMYGAAAAGALYFCLAGPVLATAKFHWANGLEALKTDSVTAKIRTFGWIMMSFPIVLFWWSPSIMDFGGPKMGIYAALIPLALCFGVWPLSLAIQRALTRTWTE